MSSSVKMPSNELAKVIFFIFLQVVTCFFFWGILPTGFLLVGYLLMKRDKDVEILKKALRLCQGYVYLTIFIILCFWLYDLNDTYRSGYYDADSKQSYLNNALIVLFVLLATSVAYLVFLNNFFGKPIERYSTWVSEYGLFSLSKQKQEQSIFKTENLKSYSVADELLKWKELKDQGLISEDEFLKMKEKIMGNDA